ncbi:hypothetical protein PoB_003077700 [Plakobranchus ocellatus]|uniref:Uncharacterized protein n=1 Tax=Plakobranchus ocellatus TaxID=259542 RepID=A0AAV4ABL4_9GAST|nr:hypothetical protein PoB_003077700 [Plakobranchus ocellatus]
MVTTKKTSTAEGLVRPTCVTAQGLCHHGGPLVLVSVRVVMETGMFIVVRMPSTLRPAQTVGSDADLPTFSSERPDPTQGVCPMPVDERAPFRMFNAALHTDTSTAAAAPGQDKSASDQADFQLTKKS